MISSSMRLILFLFNLKEESIRSVRVKGLDGRIDVEEKAIFLSKEVPGHCPRQLRVPKSVLLYDLTRRGGLEKW